VRHHEYPVDVRQVQDAATGVAQDLRVAGAQTEQAERVDP